MLGFQLEMKRETNTDYVMVYDGWEDPNVKSFSTTTDELGQPLVAANYMFRVRARNIVEFSDYSVPLITPLEM